ncbi:N-acetylmuramoyl-L-alanine amidase [Effusibacillus lacus]|uniref:SLH domain-containing protein n=1 Tax=Effusibacillus lacus TaxID=1348429 RepID=A0A292YQ48_9BACL|nr:N-acetylmuramoyl-L-alanine amidase [Effusibacillus lacus]TCS70628.1 N-acetylmuramoyl-L-alanine amidase [Effusibacillus lacus]GAX90625.1 hypothetical protein [Effusibacillus lacus]
MPLVVVDPGHGGRDPGTVGNGLQEKDVTLDAALKLREALERCGIDVIMTRTEDTLILPNGTIGEDLSARAAIANRNNADLFISWHVDSFSDPGVNGVAAWIYPTTRGTETEVIAEKIVNSVAQATGQRNRGVYVADFAVLRETNMSAVLIESGFITNPQEAANLASAAFREAQAEAAARAICKYFNLPFVPPADPVDPPTEPEPIPEWAREAIARVQNAGIMIGYEDGTFRPEQYVTRAELAVVLVRFYELLQSGRTL